jgi:hypothetical protein
MIPGLYLHASQLRVRLECISWMASRLVLQSLAAALTLARLYYKCSMMVDQYARQRKRLQSMLNAAVRPIYSARKTEHVSTLLRELHWLRVPQRIEFCIVMLTYR